MYRMFCCIRGILLSCSYIWVSPEDFKNKTENGPSRAAALPATLDPHRLLRAHPVLLEAPNLPERRFTDLRRGPTPISVRYQQAEHVSINELGRTAKPLLEHLSRAFVRASMEHLVHTIQTFFTIRAKRTQRVSEKQKNVHV